MTLHSLPEHMRRNYVGVIVQGFLTCHNSPLGKIPLLRLRTIVAHWAVVSGYIAAAGHPILSRDSVS